MAQAGVARRRVPGYACVTLHRKVKEDAMTIFDLLLILMVLGTAAGFVAVVVALALRRWKAVRRLALAGVLSWAVYLGIGTVVAMRAPQHIMARGEDRCFDEMCFAVTGWNRTQSRDVGRSLYVVGVRISNRARRRAQRELGRKGVLIDRSGRVYEVSKEGMHALVPAGGPAFPGLDAEVGPGQSIETKLVFDLPADVDYPGFALGSNLALNPARIVIGDEDHFLHWPTVWPLD
jgi:hypothetical protein